MSDLSERILIDPARLFFVRTWKWGRGRSGVLAALENKGGFMNKRRQFLSISGLAIGGVVVGGLRAEGLGSSTERAEREVLAVVAKYGSQKSIKRGVDKTDAVVIQVQMHSQEAFAETFVGPRGVPFENVHAAGNILSFQHMGVAFTLENFA